MTGRLHDPRWWRRLHHLARRDGPVRALTHLHLAVGPGAVVVGPGGHAVVPLGVGARRLWPSGLPVDPLPAQADLATPAPLRRAELSVLRGLPAAGRPESVDYRGWLLALSWLRLGGSAGLLDRARGYLSGREVGGKAMLHQQLVKGGLADVVIEQLDARAALAHHSPVRMPLAVLVEVHQQVTDADRVLLQLLGASGLVADGPGLTSYVSELLADIYLAS